MRRWISFLVTGGAAACIEYSIFTIIVCIYSDITVLAQAVSFLCGAIVSFLLNKYWVFKSSGRIHRQAFGYFILVIVNLALGSILIAWLTKGLGIHSLIAKTIVMASVVIWNYFIYQKIIFRKDDKPMHLVKSNKSRYHINSMKNIKIAAGKLKKRLKSLLDRPHAVYLVVGLIGVIGFALITPPFQGPDEQAHYIRVQYMAHGYFVPVDVKKADISLPKSIQTALKISFFEEDIRGNDGKKYDFNRTKRVIKQPLNAKERYQPPMVTYNFLTYLPAVPGVSLANLLNLNPVISLYISRLSLAIAAVLLVYFSIRTLPSKKYLFVVIGLLPMMLFQQAVVGTDGVSYGIFMLFVAYIFYLYRQPDTLTRYQWVGLLVMCGAIMWSKPLLYLFLPLTVLLYKKIHFWRWIVGAALVCVMLFGANSMMTASAGKYDAANDSLGAPENVKPDEQLANLRSNPKRGLRVLWNSYMTRYGDDETRGVIGTFGAADTLYPLWMGYLYISSLGAASLLVLDKNKDKLKIPSFWRLMGLVLVAIHFIGVNLAIYLTYTPYNFDIIYGVQGRYFIPTIVVLLVSLFMGRGIEIKKGDKMKTAAIIIAVTAVVVLLSLFIIYQRYFLYTP